MDDFTVFAWDDRKAADNERKHGIGFDEATSAMLDPRAVTMADPLNPGAEFRFVLLGLSLRHRVLVVCFCFQEVDHVIRIISARKASPGEAARYFSQGG